MSGVEVEWSYSFRDVRLPKEASSLNLASAVSQLIMFQMPFT